MNLLFQGSQEPTIGVEIEFQLIDPETRDLSPQSPKLFDLCKENNISNIMSEIHQSMFEANSGICKTVAESRKNLEKTLSSLEVFLDQLNLKFSVSGTHPFQKWTERQFFPGERYQMIERKFQWLAKRMNVYGLHVHIGLENGDQAMQVARDSSRYLPHLIALSASSPFWDSADTGMNSCRIGIMEAFPISGMPLPFTKWDRFVQYAETLFKSKVISSLKDLYWHIRPNPNFGTIEYRICDGLSTLTETMAIVSLIQALVVHLKNNPHEERSSEATKNLWIAPENLWRATRDGLEAQLIVDGKEKPIRAEIEELFSLLQPTAESLGNGKEFSDLSKILSQGNSASLQREIYKKENQFTAVVDFLAHRFASDRVG